MISGKSVGDLSDGALNVPVSVEISSVTNSSTSSDSINLVTPVFYRSQLRQYQHFQSIQLDIQPSLLSSAFTVGVI